MGRCRVKKAKIEAIGIAVAMMIMVLGTASAYTHNNPPNPPEIEGPTSGTVGNEYPYRMLVSDPDDDYMDTIEIDFGDENITLSRCCDEGYWVSGDIVWVNHNWEDQGDYVIKARVRDVYGTWGDWGTLEVYMPEKYQSPWAMLCEKFYAWFISTFGRELLPGIFNL